MEFLFAHEFFISIDCLRNALTVNLKNIDYICNLPWMSSMTDAYNNPLLSPPIFPTCDSYDSYLYSNALLLNFTTTAANYDHPTCTGNYMMIFDIGPVIPIIKF